MLALPFHRRLSVRLVTILGILTLFGSVVGAYFSMRVAEQSYFSLVHRLFHAQAQMVENSLDMVGQMAHIWADHMAGDETLRKTLHASDPKALARQLDELRMNAGCDAVIAVDRNGRILHHTAFPEKKGESLRSWKVLRDAMAGERYSVKIVEESGNFIVYSAAPVSVNGQMPRYYVLVGFRISDIWVHGISRDMPVGLSFVRRSAVMSSTFNDAQRKLPNIPMSYIDYQLLLDDARQVIQARVGEESYFVSAQRLSMMEPAMEGSLMLTYPYQSLIEVRDRMMRQYVWLFIAGMIVFSFVGWWIARRLIRPLRRLLTQMQLVSQGKVDDRLEVDSRDEVGHISATFNELLLELASKNRTLARHAEELEHVVNERTEELKLANDQLLQQATHDALTGLPNRMLFLDRLEQTLFRASREKSRIGLLFIDLDLFKWVNDTYGHAAGDELLIQTAKRIQDCLRESDSVARLGGDEFTVILGKINGAQDAEDVAKRILAALTTTFSLAEELEARISASIGIALYPDDGEDVDRLIAHADEAMYKAKTQGKATYVFWGASSVP